MEIETFLRPLEIGSTTLSSLTIKLSGTYRQLALHSLDQFLATPVTVLPSGSELGRYLAIDVGGTNLRCALIHLLGPGRGIRTSHQKSWSIEEHLKLDRAEDLFTWIASCIAEVLSDCANEKLSANSPPPIMPLGITFSFPMIQKTIAEATLMPMGKGFMVGETHELGNLLLQSYERYVRPMTSIIEPQKFASSSQYDNALPALRVAAILNDTIATFAALAYETQSVPNQRVVMGLVVGTGVNATIPLKLKDLHPSKHLSSNPHKAVDLDTDFIVVNTEWSIRGAASPLHTLDLITKWDKELDMACLVPGFQPFEYMTGGRYLGELVRLVMYDYLVNVEKTKPEHLPELLTRKDGISTEFLSNNLASLNTTSTALISLENTLKTPAGSRWSWNSHRAELFQLVARKVQVRAADLIAAATLALLACSGELTLVSTKGSCENDTSSGVEMQHLIVAYTGSTIGKYPGFLESVQSRINQLMPEMVGESQSKKIVLREAQNGGIVGAAVLAATVWDKTCKV